MCKQAQQLQLNHRLIAFNKSKLLAQTCCNLQCLVRCMQILCGTATWLLSCSKRCKSMCHSLHPACRAPATLPAPLSPSTPQIDFVLCDVNQLQQQQRLQADTVIMNPPFGTKMKGADMAFLRAACSLGPKQIYSLNKSSTRSHIQKVALK